jgi:LacI family transcriptional regulator
MIISTQELANKLGLTRVTVSRAINRDPRVAERTRLRVLAAMEEYGMEPNAIARALVHGRTNIIGILTDGVVNPFGAQWATLLDQEIRRRGYQTWLAFTDGNRKQGEDALRKFQGLRVDGIIVGTNSVVDAQLARMVRQGIAVATPDRLVHGLKCTPVMVDFGAGICQVLSYLHGLGHRRTAFIAGPDADPSSLARTEAYRQQVRTLGMELNEDLIVHAAVGADSGQFETEELRRRGIPFTALVCYNDHTAFNAIRVLTGHGLRVPQEVSVTGFDDVSWCDLWQPRLTSVAMNMPRQAQLTVEKLIDQIENGTVMTARTIRMQLVVRDSCAPPATGK